MKSLLSNFPIIFMLFGISCERKANNITNDERQQLSVPEIRCAVYSKDIQGEVCLPKQSIEERVSLLNQLLEDNGFAAKQIRIVIDPRLDNSIILEQAKLKNPTFHQVLKFNIGRRALRYVLSDGIIKIEPQRDGK